MKCTSGLPEEEQRKILDDMRAAARGQQQQEGVDPDAQARPSHTSYTTNNQSTSSSTGSTSTSNTNQTGSSSAGSDSQTGSNTGINTGTQQQSQAETVANDAHDNTQTAYGPDAHDEGDVGTVSGTRGINVAKPSVGTRFKMWYEEWLQPGSGLNSLELRRLYKAKDALNNYSSIVTDSLINISENFDAGLHLIDDIMKSTGINLNDAILADYGKSHNARAYKLMSMAMRGNKDAYNRLKPRTRAAIANMRSQIDRETINLVSIISAKQARLQLILQRGVGSEDYLKQTKKIFNTLDHTVKSMERTVEAAATGESASFLHRAYQYNSDPVFREETRRSNRQQAPARAFFAKHHIAEARKAGKILTQQEVINLADASIQDIFQRIEKGRKTDLHTTNSDAILMGQVFAFRGYAEVPLPVRQMLGEIKDPMVNYAVTIQQLNLIRTSLKYATEMEKSGQKYGMLTASPTNTNRVRITDTGNSPALLMLSNYYVSPELHDAIIEHFTVRTHDGLVRNYMKAASLVKMGKTVVSPATAIRNWISAGWMVAVHGGYNRNGITNSYDTIKLLLAGKGGTEYTRMLTSLGVIGDGISHKGLLKLSEDIGVFDQHTSTEFAKMENLKVSRLRKQKFGQIRNKEQAAQTVKQWRDFAFRFYQGADDFPKVIVFEKYRAMLAKAYDTNINDKRVIDEAAVRVKNELFTYSKVPKVIKSARNIPGTPPFISFPSEVIRTSINMGLSIKRDLTSGNKTLRNDAWVRILSIIGTAVATEELGQFLAKTISNVTDEDQEMIKISQGRFERNNNVIGMYKHDDGSYEVLNMSRYNPYSVVRNSLNELLNDDDETFEAKIVDSAFELMEPFMQSDILTTSIIEGIAGISGDQAGSPLDDTLTFMEGVAEGISPTLLNQMYRIYNTYQGDSYDYALGKRDLTREAVKVLGVSTQRMDIDKQMQFAAYDYTTVRNDAEKQVRKYAKDLNSKSISPELFIRGALERTEARQQERWGKLYSQSNYLLTHGWSKSDMVTLLQLKGAGKGSGGSIRKDEIQRLLRGMPAPPIEWPDDAVQSVINQATAVGGMQAGIDVRNRLKEVRRNMGY